MNLRKKLGGLAETAINKAIDEIDSDKLKEKLMLDVEKLIDRTVSNYLEDFKHKVKANYVDLIDGEDDIPDVE